MGLLRMEAWQNERSRSTVFPARELSPQRARAGNRQQSSKKSPRFPLGDPPPSPLGFNAFSPGFQGPRERLALPLTLAGIPAPESALGSHPCVALSSAQVTISLDENEGEKNIH